MYIDKKTIENHKNHAIQFINNFEGIENKVQLLSDTQSKDSLLSLFKELRNYSFEIDSVMLREVVECSMTDLVVDNNFKNNKLLIEIVNEICKSLKEIIVD